MPDWVKNAYYAVLFAKEAFDVYREVYENALNNYYETEKKYNVQKATELDMARAKTNVANAIPNVYNAESSVMLSLWQIVAFLAELAKSSGRASNVEIQRVRDIATRMGFTSSTVDQFFALGGDTLDDAYKVLGISPNATDDEVRKAYKKMALQNHPDRVAHLGEDVKNAATKKMQEINKAKETIFSARKMN